MIDIEIKPLIVEKERIAKELTDLRRCIKEGYLSNRTKLVREMQAVYGHLAHGGKIIDVWDTFKEIGLNEHDAPKIAIVNNGSQFCYLYKRRNGGACFSRENKEWDELNARYLRGDVELPCDTYEWKKPDEKRLKCPAPIIPPKIYAFISAQILPYHYHILYEPTEWKKSSPPKTDPILLKRLTRNLFGVLATWDLTQLEQKILRAYAR